MDSPPTYVRGVKLWRRTTGVNRRHSWATPSFVPTQPMQHALARISKIVGFPVEPSKRQTMAASNVALGVAMDLTKVHEESSPIRFFPAPGRVDGILKIIESALDESSLAPGIDFIVAIAVVVHLVCRVKENVKNLPGCGFVTWTLAIFW